MPPRRFSPLSSARSKLFLILQAACLCLLAAACQTRPTPFVATDSPPTATAPSSAQDWVEQVSRLTWVAYSPPSADPDQGIEATTAAIQADLALLRRAGFTGLVTYASGGVMGKDLVEIAQEQGYQGLILGIWDPSNQEELQNAIRASQAEIVLGYCIGNEGLGKRYQLADLSQAIQSLKERTSKPVTTTEEIDDYLDEDLLNLGDWVFPNAHPYFHNQLSPALAAGWTKAAYADLSRRAGRFVLFKEVGLPTAGGPQEELSEANQDQYYQELSGTEVKFVYFEAFDQPWKTSLPVEPYWGLFHADRQPKLIAARLLDLLPTAAPVADPAFYVYKDADFPGNHFTPSGYMGDIGDITLDPADSKNPHLGRTAIRIEYAAEGQPPQECKGATPCRWAGIYWQEPPNNWGKDEFWKDRGYNLSGYSRLAFWARADQECNADFKVGGILEPYGDSLKYPRSTRVNLTQEWQEFSIDLNGADLTYIIGGFVWASNWEMAGGPVAIYLDDIRFEK